MLGLTSLTMECLCDVVDGTGEQGDRTEAAEIRRGHSQGSAVGQPRKLRAVVQGKTKYICRSVVEEDSFQGVGMG